MTDKSMAEKIVALLNEMVKADANATAALIANRVPCNEQLAGHPTVQVTSQHGGYSVRLLGILNGLCGADGAGWGAIEAVFTKAEPDRFSDLVEFRVRETSD